MKGAFYERDFKPSPLDPCIFYVRGIISIIYFDNVLFFGPDQDNIDESIKELEYSRLLLPVEADVYAFLVVEVRTEK